MLAYFPIVDLRDALKPKYVVRFCRGRARLLQ
jgi:hypothetical protein